MCSSDLNPELTFEKTIKDAIPIQVLYDKTLIKHDDGHITGKIQNTGNQTIYYPKLFAVVHGYDRVLDITQNIEFIEKIEPGEILDFTMYPDPAITEDVFYYSCFGPVDMSVVPISVEKNEGKVDLLYDSPGTFFYDAKYDEQGTSLTIRSTNIYPFPTYSNFSNFSNFLRELREQGGEFIIEKFLIFEKLIDLGNSKILFLKIFSLFG